MPLKKAFAVGALTVCVLAGVVFGPRLFSELRNKYALDACTQEQENLQNDCIFNIIGGELSRDGITGAMHIYTKAVERFASIGSTRCHSSAHRVGDLAYYDYYVGRASLDDVEFPQETTSCGYGFFHGFIEHMVQNNPTPAFTDETCRYFTERLQSRMGIIESICYHSSGHGFLRAEIEKVPKSQWGNVSAFVSKPISFCRELKEARPSDIQECIHGTFSVILEIALLGEYGFTFNHADPLVLCASQPQSLRDICSYELSRDLSNTTRNKAPLAIPYLASISSEENRLKTFELIVEGMIMSETMGGNGYEDTYSSCKELEDPYYTSCIRGIVWGLYARGNPQNEYRRSLAFCAEPSLAASRKTALCYTYAASFLKEYYADDRIASICPLYPAQYRNACEEQLRL